MAKKLDFKAIQKGAKEIYNPKKMTYAEAVKKSASKLKKDGKLFKK